MDICKDNREQICFCKDCNEIYKLRHKLNYYKEEKLRDEAHRVDEEYLKANGLCTGCRKNKSYGKVFCKKCLKVYGEGVYFELYGL